MKKRVLFLCTGNSCRSQMAEAWVRKLKGDSCDAYSAGVEKHGMNPYADKVMNEVGVSMDGQHSKLLSELENISFDLVITVCSSANESCPIFTGKTRVVHVPFDDPPTLTKNEDDEEKKLACYRQVRDKIAEYIKNTNDF